MASPSHALRPALRNDGTAYAPLDAGIRARLAAASADVAGGLRRHRAWRYLASEQIKNQYRRTVLGPWWLTLQTAVYVLGLALVFGQLQGQSLKAFLPYVAVGFMTFFLLSSMTLNAANVFVQQAGMIKSTRQPLSSLVLRAVTADFIQFLHNAVILLLFFAFRLIDPSVWLLLVPVSVAVTLVNGVALALWLGPIVARFRDVAPAVNSVLQVAVFFTPVFYRPENLKSAETIVRLNPFTYFIDFFRDAVVGNRPPLLTVVGLAGFTVANLLVAVVVFSRSRSRLPYWVA